MVEWWLGPTTPNQYGQNLYYPTYDKTTAREVDCAQDEQKQTNNITVYF